jgi:hypothetical protein
MKRYSVMASQVPRDERGELVIKGLYLVGVRVSRGTQAALGAIRNELAKILTTQNHGKRLKGALFSNAAGLLLGMLSAQLVSQFFDFRGMHNLWGMLTERTLVSHDAFEAICFGVEFLVALVVFTLTDHFINEFRSRRRG